jgi:hypothetical protein
LAELYRWRNYGPENVANAILGAVIKNRAIVPVTPEAWVMYSLKRALPEATSALVQRVISRGLGRTRPKKGSDE